MPIETIVQYGHGRGAGGRIWRWSLPSDITKRLQDNELAGLQGFADMPVFHLRRTRRLWRLHDAIVRGATSCEDMDLDERSKILARCTRALSALVQIDREITGQGGANPAGGGDGAGVLLIPVKAEPAEWAEVVAGAADRGADDGGEV